MKLLIAMMAVSLVLSFNTCASAVPAYVSLGTDAVISETVESMVESRTKIYVGDSRTIGMYRAVTGNGSGNEIETVDTAGNVWIASPVLLKYCDALHRTLNEVLGYNQDKRRNSELLSILDTFDKEEYERAIRVLKAL